MELRSPDRGYGAPLTLSVSAPRLPPPADVRDQIAQESLILEDVCHIRTSTNPLLDLTAGRFHHGLGHR